MTAVVSRLPAAKQGTEVSVKIPKRLVHLLKSRRIHFPAPLPKLSPDQASSYHVNRRCNTSGSTGCRAASSALR